MKQFFKKQTKYVNWNEYHERIQNINRIGFMNETAQKSLKNIS